MKIINEKVLSSGTRRLIIELAPEESIIGIDERAYYKLAQPLDDIIEGDKIVDCVRVSWCSIEQKWIE